MSPVHAESPLRIPLVRHLLEDKTVGVQVRPVDARWRDVGRLTRSAPGFNPFLGKVFVAKNSGLEGWLKDPTASARPFNREDRMFSDLMFIVHDYLHIWSARLIGRLRPELGFGHKPITRANFDDSVFALLLTEAVATVGLDYWYLSTIELGEVLPIGSVMRAGLTTPYHERNVAEYRRFNPKLEVQSVEFFQRLCAFYGSGSFKGFDVKDIALSPQLLAWMNKEIRYGEKQRQVSRQWLSHLSIEDIPIAPKELVAPVDTQRPDRAELIREVATALWRKVKEDRIDPIEAPAEPPPESPPRRRADLRYRNINTIEDSVLFGEPRADEFEALMPQLLSRYDYDKFDQGSFAKLRPLAEQKDARLLADLFRDQPRLAPAADEPRELLFEG